MAWEKAYQAGNEVKGMVDAGSAGSKGENIHRQTRKWRSRFKNIRLP
jgi:hypothetical protein